MSQQEHQGRTTPAVEIEDPTVEEARQDEVKGQDLSFAGLGIFNISAAPR